MSSTKANCVVPYPETLLNELMSKLNLSDGNDKLVQSREYLNLVNKLSQLNLKAETDKNPKIDEESEQQEDFDDDDDEETAQSTILDPENRKLIQRQLILYLHSESCKARQCKQPHCRTMKNVMNHLKHCEECDDCGVPLCFSSRKISEHWKACTRDDCPVCQPIKKAIEELGTKISGAKSKATSAYVLMPQMAYVPVTCDPDAMIEISEIATRLSSDLQVSVPNVNASNQPTATPTQNTKDWHKELTPTFRDILLDRMVKAIFPTPPTGVHISATDTRIQNLLSYVKGLEFCTYKAADSRSEYFHMLAEKVYKLQKDFEAKRQRRKVLHRAAKSGSSYGSLKIK